MAGWDGYFARLVSTRDLGGSRLGGDSVRLVSARDLGGSGRAMRACPLVVASAVARVGGWVNVVRWIVHARVATGRGHGGGVERFLGTWGRSRKDRRDCSGIE